MANYNSYYPGIYQSPYMSANYAQPQPQPMYQHATAPQPQSGIIWVQGEAGAKAYPVAPGSNVLLMDSEGECFYIKSTDASGMPLPLRVFEYTEIVRTEPAMQSHAALPDFNPSEYVRRDEFEEMKRQLEEERKSNASRNRIERKEVKDGK